MIATFYRRHPLLGIHLGIVVLLLLGLVQRTGMSHLGFMALYVTALLFGYVVIDRMTRNIAIPTRIGSDARPLAVGVLLATMVVAVLHWVAVGHVPLIEALRQNDNLVVQEIRRRMTMDAPLWLNYASNFMLKAFIPFTLLVCYGRCPKLFASVAVVGVLYALSLVQKSYVITLFVPLWFAFLISRRWIQFATLTSGFILALFFLMIVAKPEKLAQVQENEQDITAEQAPVIDPGVKENGLFLDLVRGLARRVLLMPGWTVAAWFEHVPSDIPFQKGGAVRPLAALTGREYMELDRRIYDLEYPEFAAKNTRGTMGSASFMYGWANFGWWGLVLSGFITAGVLKTVTLLFARRWEWAVCLSAYPLLMLSSVALPTVMLTHGWMLTLLLFVLFAPPNAPGE
ncbi:MAG: hypothetical protein IT229_02275 [Flavobacteriales bacterium]|nr:hypothetical protein [Flavobacteriales bacterium]